MKLSFTGFAGFLLLFICFSPVRAQTSPDSALYKESVSKIRQVYFDEIGDNAQIYHGSEYIRNGQKANGFPFYESNDQTTGSVSYQGTLYSNQSLYYNLVSDEVIINNYAHSALIALAMGKVDSFTLLNHVFVPLYADKASHLQKSGYYDQLYAGEPAVYARREKRMVVGSGSEETRYIQHDDYFIEVKGVYYPVDGKSALLDVLKDQEDLLKKYIRTNKLNFKKDFESSLVLTTIYYSQLKH